MEQIIGFIQTVYAFIVANLGLKAYASNPTGTALGRLAYIVEFLSTTDFFATKYAVASDSLKASSDAEATTAATTDTLVKEIQVGKPGEYRVSFDLYTSVGTAYGRIYVNGVAVGSQRSTSSTTAVTYTEDIPASSQYSLIQIYAKNGTTYIAKVKNFRISYTEQSLPKVNI